MPTRRWFDRQFDLGLPPETFPDIIERVRGTPARLEERVRDGAPAQFVQQVDGAWSIQENIGHLLDLEPLWAGRLDDLLAGAEHLRPADLQNRKTHEARHNERELAGLLGAFRQARMDTVARLDHLDADEVIRSALHPRLEQPMTVVDLFFFVAEHDDHHLARIGEIVRVLTTR
jgi:uncharacterized damage-inducible protein DinB